MWAAAANRFVRTETVAVLQVLAAAIAINVMLLLQVLLRLPLLLVDKVKIHQLHVTAWLFILPAAHLHVLKVQQQAATGTALAVVLDLTVIFVTVH